MDRCWEKEEDKTEQEEETMTNRGRFRKRRKRKMRRNKLINVVAAIQLVVCSCFYLGGQQCNKLCEK